LGRNFPTKAKEKSNDEGGEQDGTIECKLGDES